MVLVMYLLAALPWWESKAVVGPSINPTVNKLIRPPDLEVFPLSWQLSLCPHGGGRAVAEGDGPDPRNHASIWSRRSSPAVVYDKLQY